MDTLDTIFISIIVTLLGLALPIFVQIISTIDQNYRSSHIRDILFSKIDFFYFSLAFSVAIGIVYSLKIPSYISLKPFDFFIGNSAIILLILLTVILLISYGRLTFQILLFLNPPKLARELMRQWQKSKRSNYFGALSDFFLKSLQNNEPEKDELQRFFYKVFESYRNDNLNQSIVYPNEYYGLNYRVLEYLVNQKNLSNASTAYRVAGHIWLLGESYSKISSQTYQLMWSDLRLMVQLNKPQYILYHWEVAHQFYEYHLTTVPSTFNDRIENINQENIDDLEIERKDFKEFHFLLGGLLLYSENFSALSQIFRHTNSEPPKYVLLPSSMHEIFGQLLQISEDRNYRYYELGNRFSFPNASGVNSDRVTIGWLKRYLILLYLRQFTLQQYYVHLKPTEVPHIPTKQGDKKKLLDQMDWYISVVESHINNPELIKSLGWEFLRDQDYFIKRKIPNPIEFITSFKNQLIKAYEKDNLELEIDPEKQKKFTDTSIRIIQDQIEILSKFGRTDKLEGGEGICVVGSHALIEKDAMSKTPQSEHLNYDSFLAGGIKNDIMEFFVSQLIQHTNTPNSFVLEPNDLIEGVEKLKLNKNHYVLILGSFPQVVDSLQKMNIDHIVIDYNHFDLKGIYIINNSERPEIYTPNLFKNVSSIFKTEKVSDKFNIYANVIDLNKDNLVRSHVLNQHNELGQSIRSFALQIIELKFCMKWKSNSEIIRIQEFYAYRNEGLPDKISNITPLL